MKRKLFVVLAVLVALAFCLPAFGVDLYPTRNNDGRIGKSGKAWGLGYFYDLYVQDDLTVTDDAAVGGDLTVTGTLTATSPALTTPTITSPNVTFGVTATQHDYTAHADWTLSTTEATYLLLVTSSGDGTNSNIIAYPTPSNGKLYVVRNGSKQNNIIKPSGGTGITIASGKTASVIFWGTDFIRVTADATH
jgi:hypothetical protein